MSTSTPEPAQSGSIVASLPPGVTVQPGRETSQTNSAGQVVQGMLFPITLANGSTTTVFVPYAQLGQADYVQQLFTQRIDAINVITG